MTTHMMKPLFKYPGGKSSEYKYLSKLFPKFSFYVEPFLGGGASYWATDADKWLINDFSDELVSVYLFTRNQDPLFIEGIREVSELWQLKNIYCNKIMQIMEIPENKAYNEKLFSLISRQLSNVTNVIPIEKDDLEKELSSSFNRKIKTITRFTKQNRVTHAPENALGILGSAIYTYLRSMYNSIEFGTNPQIKTVLYFFMREYSYSSMFRFNLSGNFNVPFGGNSYAKKSFQQRLLQITDPDVINKLRNTEIKQGDFSQAMPDQLNTFIFLDPPYDTEFSTYNLHVFDAHEQIRLRNKLAELNKSKWLIVTKSTPFIEELYSDNSWYKYRFDKHYSVNFKNRNTQLSEHLVVTNYKMEG